jgi:hypothetical protein
MACGAGFRRLLRGAIVLKGTVANTDRGWFEYLRGRPDLDEVNF